MTVLSIMSTNIHVLCALHVQIHCICIKHNHRFILQDLDELHLFVASDMAKLLQQKLDELMERNSYSEFEQ